MNVSDRATKKADVFMLKEFKRFRNCELLGEINDHYNLDLRPPEKSLHTGTSFKFTLVGMNTHTMYSLYRLFVGVCTQRSEMAATPSIVFNESDIRGAQERFLY